jgi:hypothetical protein
MCISVYMYLCMYVYFCIYVIMYVFMYVCIHVMEKAAVTEVEQEVVEVEEEKGIFIYIYMEGKEGGTFI